MSIEDAGYSMELYNILKRKGINFVADIPRKLDYEKLPKRLLLELLREHGDFNY